MKMSWRIGAEAILFLTIYPVVELTRLILIYVKDYMPLSPFSFAFYMWEIAAVWLGWLATVGVIWLMTHQDSSLRLKGE